jgi:Carboxypeptidase regulatory-like domain
MERSMDPERFVISGYVKDKNSGSPIRNAKVTLHKKYKDKAESAVGLEQTLTTDSEGRYEIAVPPDSEATFRVRCEAFGKPGWTEGVTATKRGETYACDILIPLNFEITLKAYAEDETVVDCRSGTVGQRFLARLERVGKTNHQYRWSVSPDANVTPSEDGCDAQIVPRLSGQMRITLSVMDSELATVSLQKEMSIADADVQMVGGRMNVRLERTASFPTLDQALWAAIRRQGESISFDRYRDFIDRVMAEGYDFHTKMGNPLLDSRLPEVRSRRHGVQAYELLKVATQVFLLLNCGIRTREDLELDRRRENYSFDWMIAKLEEYLGTPPQLPYLKRVVRDAFPWLERDGVRCGCVLTSVREPCLIELFRDYWFEEGMLMQSMNAITRRFQNVHAPDGRDPLAHLEIDPLRPMANILWGRSQDVNLLSVKRRTYEYMHQYGLGLYGKATASVRPADTRSKFLEAFHNLLYLCSVFFKEDNDTTVIADGYPLLNALREVHLILAQGAHNQFGDLSWTARAETMVQQWILAQPEIREFLQSRAMVPYKEAWMPQVDTMKSLQGWSDVTVSVFRDLGAYGEQIVLSIRYGDWIGDINEDHAKNWARWYRSDIQAYLHAYRAVTGVDLTNPDTVDATLPAIHLQKRLAIQQGSAR